MYDFAWTVKCPYCKAEVGKPCINSNKTHDIRVAVANETKKSDNDKGTEEPNPYYAGM